VSIDTWRQEFYPVDAFRVGPGVSSIEHSLKKWSGLRKENLERHGCRSTGSAIRDNYGRAFRVGGATCALCHHYADASEDEGMCALCPLSETRDGVACDDLRDDEGEHPYGHWIQFKNPEPMIEWLEKTLLAERAKGVESGTEPKT
jgi:hypothetical protein